jgi:hypothetical protein
VLEECEDLPVVQLRLGIGNVVTANRRLHQVPPGIFAMRDDRRRIGRGAILMMLRRASRDENGDRECDDPGWPHDKMFYSPRAVVAIAETSNRSRNRENAGTNPFNGSRPSLIITKRTQIMLVPTGFLVPLHLLGEGARG